MRTRNEEKASQARQAGPSSNISELICIQVIKVEGQDKQTGSFFQNLTRSHRVNEEALSFSSLSRLEAH